MSPTFARFFTWSLVPTLQWFLLSGSAFAQQTSLPACPSDPKTYFLHCLGVLTYPTGTNYVGEFRANKLAGQGTVTWPDGNKYVGTFSDNQLNGQGTLYSSSGTIKNQGLWANNSFIKEVVQPLSRPSLFDIRDKVKVSNIVDKKEITREEFANLASSVLLLSGNSTASQALQTTVKALDLLSSVTSNGPEALQSEEGVTFVGRYKWVVATLFVVLQQAGIKIDDLIDADNGGIVKGTRPQAGFTQDPYRLYISIEDGGNSVTMKFKNYSAYGNSISNKVEIIKLIERILPEIQSDYNRCDTSVPTSLWNRCIGYATVESVLEPAASNSKNFFSAYHGEFEGGKANGLGLLISKAGWRAVGFWYNGRPFGDYVIRYDSGVSVESPLDNFINHKGLITVKPKQDYIIKVDLELNYGEVSNNGFFTYKGGFNVYFKELNASFQWGANGLGIEYDSKQKIRRMGWWENSNLISSYDVSLDDKKRLALKPDLTNNPLSCPVSVDVKFWTRCQGTYQGWLSSYSYRGEFLDGDFHNRGVKVFSDGTRQEGRWEKGIFKGQ